MANVRQVNLKAGPPSAGLDKAGNEKDMIQYDNNLGCLPSADTRHIGVSSQQLSSITKTSYCKIETASLNNYYNHSDIRAVHLDKAPWNDFYFLVTIIGLVAMLFGFTDGFDDPPRDPLPNDMLYLGIVGLAFFLLFLAKLVYQYMRPKVFASVDTARYGPFPCGWGNLSESLVFIGKGPGVDVMSDDDIGHGALSLLQNETVLQRHEGRKIKGELSEVILTDKRISVRRSKRCCCNMILRQDKLSSYKLEQIASTTADQSFPLWWILATIWFLGVVIGYFVECSEENQTLADAVCGTNAAKKEEWMNMMYVFFALSLIFFYMASNMAGGVGYCRRAFVTIYFNSPMYFPCLWMNQFEVLELPKGVAQGRADKIARSIMAAKDRKAKSNSYV